MTFDQLQYFVAVVESSTFFDAAESLHIAQSTLSKQIRNLELELDVQLFDRSPRHASLTEAGRALYPDAVKLLKGIQGMKQHLAPYQDSRKSIIHLGVLPILHQYRLNPILKQFTESHPEISLLIDEVEDEPLRQGFRHGSYDLVIGRPELLTGIQSTCHLLAHDRLVLLTPTDHPLAGRAAVPLEELSGESFILMHPDSSIHRLCLTACQKKGFQPAVTRTAKIESIVSAVAEGLGVAVLPQLLVERDAREGRVVMLPFREPLCRHLYGVYHEKKHLSKSMRRFLELCQALGTPAPVGQTPGKIE